MGEVSKARNDRKDETALLNTVEMLLCAASKRRAYIHLSMDGRRRSSRYTSRHANID
jgi:hypothetical protein